MLLNRVNKAWCQLLYYYKIKANFVIYKTSINNDINDNNSNSNNDSFNKNDDVKIISI